MTKVFLTLTPSGDSHEVEIDLKDEGLTVEEWLNLNEEKKQEIIIKYRNSEDESNGLYWEGGDIRISYDEE